MDKNTINYRRKTLFNIYNLPIYKLKDTQSNFRKKYKVKELSVQVN